MTEMQKDVLLLVALGVIYTGFVMYLRAAPPSQVSRALEGRLYRRRAAKRGSSRVAMALGTGLFLVGVAEVVWFTMIRTG
ncbi:hypothetical protein SAMN02745225_02258 [Ferrithrix thermotolerans DSM 19514]|uniref:Uncharacterized protein n=1 Tax=Ferrithrix thermotolerans DSM 19514 TaxID=1121881 RepID=A0A1M4Y6P4_9ACTN|nr:hypothetical protein SAMN02745225_02258 [Ferrithrix thermotolerans DSM 19514]